MTETGWGRLTAWTAVMGAFSALAYGARLAGERPPDDALYRWDSVASALIQFALFAAIVLAILIRRPKREYLALRRPASWATAARIAAAIIGVLWLLAFLLGRFLDPSAEQGLVPSHWEPDRAAPFAANFLVVALVAPIVEELTFRGLGFTLLVRFGRRAAIVLTALAFALAHGLVEGLPLLLVFGAGLAYLRARTDSVLPGILLHAGFNAFVLLAAVDFFQA